MTYLRKPVNLRSGRSGLRPTRRTFVWVVLCSLLAGVPQEGWAQGEGDAEYKIKLAFLYNFAQFIQWPVDAFPNATAPLTICVAGPDPFHSDFEEGLRGHTVGGHPMEIRQLKPNDGPAGCHMIFIRASERKLAERLLAATKGSSTLTVGETKGFADLGGVINLTLDQDKLRFEINLDAAMQTRLKISSKLLALAKIIRTGQIP